MPIPTRSIAYDGTSLESLITSYKNTTAGTGATLGCIRMAPGEYHLTAPLDLHGVNPGVGGKFSLLGSGPSTRIIGNFPGAPVIDTTGASQITMKNFTVENWDTVNVPDEGILFSRLLNNDSAQECFVDRVRVEGYFKHAAVMNISGELHRFRDCRFVNHQDSGDGYAWCSQNEYGVSSPYTAIQQGQASTTDTRLERCKIAALGAGGRAVTVIGLAEDQSWVDCLIQGGPAGNCVYMGGGNPQFSTHFDGCRFEGVNCSYVFGFQNAPRIVLKNSSVIWGGVSGHVFLNVDQSLIVGNRFSQKGASNKLVPGDLVNGYPNAFNKISGDVTNNYFDWENSEWRQVFCTTGQWGKNQYPLSRDNIDPNQHTGQAIADCLDDGSGNRVILYSVAGMKLVLASGKSFG